MLILQHSKQKLNPSPFGLQSRLDDKGQLVIKNSQEQQKSSNRMSYQVYLFDFIQLLSHFTFMSTHSPILIHSLLRHKEGKTFKFIIRNLYYLMTMVVDETDKLAPSSSKEFTVWFDHQTFYGSNKKRIDIINEFFKRVMFDNPHLTHQEKKAKLEARQIFQREVLKNLCDQSQKLPLWPALKIIYNLGALWLMSVVFNQESLENQQVQDKQIESIVISMQKYRNIYRNNMIKSMINECQQQYLKPLTNHSSQIVGGDQIFFLLRHIQMIQLEVKDNLKFFEQQKDPIQICIQTLFNILLPFESQLTLWSDGMKNSSQADLGFVSKPNLGEKNAVQPAPNIDEEIESEEDEEDESEESEDSDEDMDEEEDDEGLLDSELSERNFRFSQHDMMDGDEEEEEDEDEEDDGFGRQGGPAGAANRRHHHNHHHPLHHHNIEEDEEDDISSEDEEGSGSSSYDEEVDENDPGDLQLIQEILQRGPSTHDMNLIDDDYGNENDDDEDMEDEVIQEEDQNQENNPNQEEAKRDEAAAEDDDCDSFEDQEDYGDEEMGEDDDDEGSYDDEYDEEIEEDEPEQIQIFVGRNPDQMDRISHQDQSQVQRGQPGFRRDDVLSINNMSVDMFNIGRAAVGAQNFHQNSNAHENESADFSSEQQDQEDDFSDAAPGGERWRRPRDPHQLEVISSQARLAAGSHLFNDIIGLIMGNSGAASGSQQRPAQQDGRPSFGISRVDQIIPVNSNIRDDTNYKPVQTMLEIVSLGKEMQRRQNIYKIFIKEVSNSIEQPLKQEQQQIHQEAKDNKGEHQENKKSQISSKIPFELASKENKQNMFGQFDIRSLQGLAAQPISSQTRQSLPQIQGDDIELDPEFVENLDQTGLQNIADSENMMNFIQNQSNRQQPSEGGIYTTVQLLQSITSREERQRMFRTMPLSTLNQLPSELYTEGLLYRRLDQDPTLQRQSSSNQQSSQPLREIITSIFGSQGNGNQIGEIRVRLGSNNLLNTATGGTWNQGRSRLHSMDQQLNDITDFSRQPNDPYIRSNVDQPNTWVSQASRMIQSMIADKINVEDNSIYVSFNQYLQNYILEMKDKTSFDLKGSEINAHSENIIQQALINSNKEVNESNFNQINQIIEMVSTWVKLFTNSTFVLQSECKLMELLYKIPNIRLGLIIKTIQWFLFGLLQLIKYDAKISDDKSLMIKSSLETQAKAFQIDIGLGLSGKLPLQIFVLQCLKSLQQITSSGFIIPKKPSLNALDLLILPNTNPNLTTYLSLLNHSSPPDTPFLSPDDSLLSQILDSFVTFLKLVNTRPSYLQGDSLDDKENERLWIDILRELSILLKQVSGSYRLQQQSSQSSPTIQVKMSVKADTIQKLSGLMLEREFKTKAALKIITSIFNELSALSGEGQKMVEELFKVSLNRSLEKFAKIVEEGQIDIKELQKEVVVINQILKFSQSAQNNKSESNICDLDLFIRVVKSVSKLIERKHLETVTSNLQQAAFMFKEDFRTIMTTLFVLFEFNLKSIFAEEPQPLQPPRRRPGPNGRRAPPRQRAQQIQSQIQIIMEDANELKEEIAHENNSINVSKDRQALVQAIDKHLQLKIKDEKVRQDQRLTCFITFCLEHKKIINSFIRANQQILNESLRNVIIKVPHVLDFDNKRLLFRSQIKKIQKKYRLKYFDINVQRDNVFADSYDQLKHINADRWKGKMNVEFQDEQGIDEGGLTREWFILLSQKIFNPDLALFLQSNAGSTYYPNPNSTVDPEYPLQFKFIGRIVGKAIYEQQLLDCYFVKAFYKILLGMPLTYHDVEDFDNEVYKNLKWCLDNPVEGLGFTFSEIMEYFGKTDEVEFVQGGKEIDVTDENKYEYVQKKAYYKLYLSVKKQIDSFLQGFYEIVPKELVQIFDNRELELLISGLPNIDIMDLKENTVYQNYTEKSPVVRWLFEVLEEFDNSERAEFIQFVTGSSKVPVEGFKGLRGSRGLQKFQIVKFFTNDTNRLPQAHTCFKQLELPEYQSKEKLKERLLTAIKEGKTFGFA